MDITERRERNTEACEKVKALADEVNELRERAKGTLSRSLMSCIDEEVSVDICVDYIVVTLHLDNQTQTILNTKKAVSLGRILLELYPEIVDAE